QWVAVGEGCCGSISPVLPAANYCRCSEADFRYWLTSARLAISARTGASLFQGQRSVPLREGESRRAPMMNIASFDQFVGSGDQCWRDRQAQRLRRRQVDD